jgi:cephalosporin hydroxylase
MEGNRLDLSRIDLVQKSTNEQLDDPKYLERLTMDLGLNDEHLNEQPEFVKQFGGGLHIWQYPNQFAKYLCLLGQFKIHSYLEIGCRWGGTFVYTCEFLKKKCGLNKSVAVDLIESPVQKYCSMQKDSSLIVADSQSKEFKNYISEEFFDLILIDGDHDYEPVLSDYHSCRGRSNILVFHDITNDGCPGVAEVWRQFRESSSDEYEFHEMTEQYEEVTERTGMRYLGIGVAIRKSFAKEGRAN